MVQHTRWLEVSDMRLIFCHFDKKNIESNMMLIPAYKYLITLPSLIVGGSTELGSQKFTWNR